MSRNIEVGCLVVILHANMQEVVGRTGVVVSMEHGHFVSYLGNVVDGTGWWDVKVDGFEKLICRPASSLLRIDNYDNSEETTEQDKELTV